MRRPRQGLLSSAHRHRLWSIPVESSDSQRFTVALVHRLEHGATSADLAHATTEIWRGIDAALSPIIGRRGVDALFRRSVHVAMQRHEWLAQVYTDTLELPGLANLANALERQPADQAASGGGALIDTFHTLLIGLIGASLTERLFRAVWVTVSANHPPQDTSA